MRWGKIPDGNRTSEDLHSMVKRMVPKDSQPPVIVAKSFSDADTKSSVNIFAPDTTPVSRGALKFWLDGSIIFNGHCIRRTSDLDGILPPGVAFWSIDQIAAWWSQGARNPGALYIEDTLNDWGACLPDPLGGALAFAHKKSDLSLVSTSIVSLSKKSSALGHALEKDPLFQIERLILGNGGLTPSSYQNVESLEPFQYYLVKGNQIFTKNYSVLDSKKDASLLELFLELRSDVLSAVQAIADSNSEQVISHLTGGFDSRLVLAAILNLGVQDKVNIFCSGPEGSTDRVIADGLTRRYGLRRVDGAGLATAPTNNMPERLMGALFASGGITNTGPFGREKSARASAMGGGYGEVLRTFFGNRNFIDGNGNIDESSLINSFMPNINSANSYISESAFTHLSTKLVNKFKYLSSVYQDTDFIGDAFYTHNRNRYHIGQTSLLWSRIGSRFDPLYSVAGFELSRRSTQYTRSSNLLGFDLMDSLSKELLNWPFDYDRFNDSLLQSRRRPHSSEWPKDQTKITFEKGLLPEVSDDSPFLGVLRQLDATEPNPTNAERKAMVSQANKLGVNFWQVVYKRTGQELLTNAYEQTGGKALQGLVDEKYILKLATSKELNKKQLRDLYSLAGILTWLSFG